MFISTNPLVLNENYSIDVHVYPVLNKQISSTQAYYSSVINVPYFPSFENQPNFLKKANRLHIPKDKTNTQSSTCALGWRGGEQTNLNAYIIIFLRGHPMVRVTKGEDANINRVVASIQEVRGSNPVIGKNLC